MLTLLSYVLIHSRFKSPFTFTYMVISLLKFSIFCKKSYFCIISQSFLSYGFKIYWHWMVFSYKSFGLSWICDFIPFLISNVVYLCCNQVHNGIVCYFISKSKLLHLSYLPILFSTSLIPYFRLLNSLFLCILDWVQWFILNLLMCEFSSFVLLSVFKL